MKTKKKSGEHYTLTIMRILRTASLRSNFTTLLVLAKKNSVSILKRHIQNFERSWK